VRFIWLINCNYAESSPSSSIHPFFPFGLSVKAKPPTFPLQSDLPEQEESSPLDLSSNRFSLNHGHRDVQPNAKANLRDLKQSSTCRQNRRKGIAVKLDRMV